MTDKQIIIDGVDIAGCEDYGYRGKAGYWCHYYDEPCTDYPNCYYKQLKRKEKKCEELSKILAEIKEYCTNIKKDHYWGMRIIRFTNIILQKISECEVDLE